MSPAYRRGLRDHLPEANVTFDRFHVVKLLNEAVDQARRAESKEAPELSRTRYLQLRNTTSFSRTQQHLLNSLPLQHPPPDRDRLPDDARLPGLLDAAGQEASRFLRGQCQWARGSGLERMARFARVVEVHRRGILYWLRTKISNGLLEGLSSLFQSTKARARGFRSTRNLVAMIYLMHGKLPNLQPT